MCVIAGMSNLVQNAYRIRFCSHRCISTALVPHYTFAAAVCNIKLILIRINISAGSEDTSSLYRAFIFENPVEMPRERV